MKKSIILTLIAFFSILLIAGVTSVISTTITNIRIEKKVDVILSQCIENRIEIERLKLDHINQTLSLDSNLRKLETCILLLQSQMVFRPPLLPQKR